jgi:hypothetical protein
MSAAELDAEMLATLTPEEREAIEGSELSEADVKALEKVAGEASLADDNDDETDDDGDDDGDGDGDAAAAAAPIEGAKPAPAADAGQDDDQDDEPAPQAVPRYEAKLPSDYDDQIKALKDRDAELRQKFKDGEIDIDERDAGLSQLSEQREQLLVLRAKAEISQEMTQQTAAQQWQNTVNSFLSAAAKEEGGIDYRKDGDKAADLDQFVKVLAAKPENSDKPMQWFLEEAHKRVMALHGVAKPTSKPGDAVAEAVSKRKVQVDAMPKTLAQVPGSDGPGDVAGEFADIEALDGMEYEDAIARMTPAQREKFLRGR